MRRKKFFYMHLSTMRSAGHDDRPWQIRVWMNMFFFLSFYFLWAILNEVITGINFAQFLYRAYHLVIGSECYRTSLELIIVVKVFLSSIRALLFLDFADRISPEIWEVINWIVVKNDERRLKISNLMTLRLLEPLYIIAKAWLQVSVWLRLNDGS